MSHAQRIVRPATAFSKDPSKGRRRPREKAPEHLAFVRRRPCVCCLSRIEVQAAHVRMASPRHGKRATGLGEKPSDKFSVPLCQQHHLDGEDAQHRQAERAFWEKHGIDPCDVAVRLWAVSGDDDAGELVIREARNR